MKDALWGGQGRVGLAGKGCGYPPELAWWTGGQGGGARAPGCKGFGSGGVGGRDTGPRDGANFATYVVFLSFLHIEKEEKWRFLKDALWGGGGGTHRSWPGGRGGRPRALVAGEGWGGRRSDGSSRVGAWLAVPKRSKSREGVREGLAWRSGGVQGLRLRG